MANLPVLRVAQADRLPNNTLWENRFEIKSETSGRVYIIAQNKAKRHFGCSCPSYRTRRRCKHLETLLLPCNEVPHEVSLTNG